MKSTYHRMTRRRVERPLRLRYSSRSDRGPRPVMDALDDGIPAEVIDLATGPFQRNYPALARNRRKHR